MAYAWCFVCPLIPPGPLFECWIHVMSAATALKYVAFVFTISFPFENVFGLLGVHGKAFSFSEGT